jgi:DNA (cytosine-5)-methyltransferase 1
MTEDEWKKYAAQTLKAELARAGVGYEELTRLLHAIEVEESYKGIASKITRGTFSFLFFAQCMKALDIKTVRLGE